MRGEGNLANGEQQQICLAGAYAGVRARAVEKNDLHEVHENSRKAWLRVIDSGNP